MMHTQRTHFPYQQPISPASDSSMLIRWLVLLSACALLGFAFSAQAQIFGSVNTGFGCGSGGGNILQSGNCPSSIEDGKIFSYFVCNMEKLIGETFGSFYCQLQSKFLRPMSAVMTLAVTLFGAAFLIGVIPATARDSMVFLFKACAVWGFATQADLLIGVAYNFFMGGLKEGIAIVVSGVFKPAGGMPSGGGQGGQQIYEYMDEIFKKFVNLSTESVPEGQQAQSEDERCKNAVFAVMTLLALAFPPLFAFGVFLFIRFIAFFLRAVFGYIYAIIGISVLIVLAPIFLSFYFWRQTQDYFARWVAYLASFAMQMVIIFAFIAFVLSMDFKSISKNLMDLVVPYNEAVETQGIRWPWKVCTICEFEVTDSQGNSVSGGNVPPGGSVRCKDNPGKPIPPTSLTGPGKNKGGGMDMNSTLMALTFKTILTLLVLGYVLTALIEIVPTIAARLASANLIGAQPLVGQNMPLPAEGAMQTFEDKFMQRISEGGNPVVAYSEAFKEASAAMVTGARNASGGVVSPGLVQSFQGFLWNGPSNLR